MRSKYRAVRTEVDGIKFASKKEAARYQELKALERSGLIHHLELQKRYELRVKDIKIATYIADFVYEESSNRKSHFSDRIVVEDVKGFKTPVYRLKKKLFEALYPFKITEI